MIPLSPMMFSSKNYINVFDHLWLFLWGLVVTIVNLSDHIGLLMGSVLIIFLASSICMGFHVKDLNFEKL